ncbi:DUF6624 domain-containing protein [Nonomuraea gerenzanensis]|uniref:Uncharacterized protein n=1 Tax=Nonomuraea gerenzanensis TaxID=93944 RepID=A0A1M4DWF5_9ACTN|nr:DUF6624 domain-containing protein [Nonomuraea gerenzanensis]UBU13256.1 hypothetical protein LCN96_55000 [Nonomuraea gerenzanensis]SBO90907.1 hypothetical protein BN4615_P421 [Nonomuraea gerenzanensis]
MTDEELRDELLRRMEMDQAMRDPAKGFPGDKRLARLQRLDEGNTAWLYSVVATRGWPLISQVGERAARAAWLLAQHATSRAVQRLFHELMADAVDSDEASPHDFAYLVDRVRVRSGRPQLYGTQFHNGGDGLEPMPIEDPDLLDERRRAMGLEPFADYEAFIKKTGSP